jgi:hypothetical protein
MKFPNSFLNTNKQVEPLNPASLSGSEANVKDVQKNATTPTQVNKNELKRNKFHFISFTIIYGLKTLRIIMLVK